MCDGRHKAARDRMDNKGGASAGRNSRRQLALSSLGLALLALLRNFMFGKGSCDDVT